jgi:peptide chain release factor 2
MTSRSYAVASTTPGRTCASTRCGPSVREDVELVDRLDGEVDDAHTLFELGREEDDDSVEPEIVTALERLRAELDRLELRALFTGEHDERDAVCEVHSGAGGTDAQDWTEMLLRMYTRWAERRGFDVELDAVSEGTEAGISSATFIVKGRYAYGLLSGEKGVHRLIRISPFDANARRQTAFASLDAVPAIEEAEEPDIDANDLRIDTYRSSGAGGQHVNVTDSAVRITHLPTGIVVSCQNERSQIQNRAKAMQILAARLAERQREERRAELEKLSGEKSQVAFGSQIRSYTLAPYQLVKDERTRYETGNVQAVLDGDLDPFVEAYLQWRRQHAGSA